MVARRAEGRARWSCHAEPTPRLGESQVINLLVGIKRMGDRGGPPTRVAGRSAESPHLSFPRPEESPQMRFRIR